MDVFPANLETCLSTAKHTSPKDPDSSYQGFLALTLLELELEVFADLSQFALQGKVVERRKKKKKKRKRKSPLQPCPKAAHIQFQFASLVSSTQAKKMKKLREKWRKTRIC